MTQMDPDLGSLIVQYLDQPDPPEDRPETPAVDDNGQVLDGPQPVPEGTWTLSKLKQAVNPTRLEAQTDEERYSARKQAWAQLESAPYAPPRLKLGALLVELYEGGREDARAALMQVFLQGRLGYGVWQGLKQIYKLAEVRHDAAMFGVLAYRLDAGTSLSTTGEISAGTFLYMRRRAWRYLRMLGQAVPELYPTFAVEVLRHYPDEHYFGSSWVASQVWCHADMVDDEGGASSSLPSDLDKVRAFREAWKLSSDPLFLLLEVAASDMVCDFGIRCLKLDFPDALNKVDPAWLARVGFKPLGSMHDLVVSLLEANPDFHRSKIESLGLKPMVLGLLQSPSKKARVYAIEYVRAHVTDLPEADLVQLALTGASNVVDLAVQLLGRRDAKAIGLAALAALLEISRAEKMAGTMLKAGFGTKDVTQDIFISMMTESSEQRNFVVEWFKSDKKKIPTGYLTALLSDPRCDYSARRYALGVLPKRPGKEIGLPWIKAALFDRQLEDYVSRWLQAGLLKGDALDLDWVKGLALRAHHRSLALSLLDNREIVSPRAIGLQWLLTLSRHPEPDLQEFAHRYMLENFAPEDLGDTPEAGVDRLWALASGKEPEAVRAFAATYLRVHHPEMGPTLKQARQLGLKPKLKAAAYGLERVQALFNDDREDVRRLAADIARWQLVSWDDSELLYALMEGAHREPRSVAAELLLSIDEAPSEKTRPAPPAEWLDAARVFRLAESAHKAAREVAVTLVRRHYERLGGAERLAWLMESPDRSVRLFAVRLLWERHRPRDLPADYKAPKEGPIYVGKSRFASVSALADFMKVVLYALPPGRADKRELVLDGATPDRALPASIAKRRLVEVVRALAEEDVEFAQVILPILQSFTKSEAKGEWQACVAALVRIRQKHPELEVALQRARV